MKIYNLLSLFFVFYALGACQKKTDPLDIDSSQIVKEPTPTATTYLKDVPYFYQYGNTENPSGSCQNTCIAMVLKYFAMKEGLSSDIYKHITPDNLTKTWGTKKAQTVSGLQEVFNTEAAKIGVKTRGTGTETMPLDDFRKAATNSKTPFIVHGYFTDFGHILVVLGFDGKDYICNDPAGKWSTQYKNGGYSGANSTEGIAIKYPKQAFEAAISPDNMVWVHSYK